MSESFATLTSQWWPHAFELLDGLLRELAEVAAVRIAEHAVEADA